MDKTETIYSELIKNTLEIVCRMAGANLANSAVNYVKGKYKKEIKKFEYSRYSTILEVKSRDKAGICHKIFLELIGYIREIIGNNVVDYANQVLEKMKAERKLKGVSLSSLSKA